MYYSNPLIWRKVRRTIFTSISDLNDVLVYLRFGNPDLRWHLEVLRVLVLVLLHEGRLDGLTLLWWRGCPCWAVWLVGVETVVAAVCGIPALSPQEYPLLQVNTQVGVSSVGKLYVSHHCKIYVLFWEGRVCEELSRLLAREVSIKTNRKTILDLESNSRKQWEAIKSEKSAVEPFHVFPFIQD